MEIYVEYAFLENFLFDGVLLWLAFYAARVKVKKRKLALSAACGGGFALLFPLLRLGGILALVCKLSMGALLCIIPFHRLSTAREWRKYLFVSALFFGVSFAFGGSLLGIYSQFSFTGKPVVPAYAVLLGFAILVLFFVWLVKKIYAQRAVFSRVVPCVLYNGENKAQADGFLDSGNLAMKNGVPVCFLSPDLIYDLFETKNQKGEGQVCDEMSIHTLAGEKKVRLYLAEIEVKGERKKAYFAPMGNMIGREYKILLNGRLMGETYEVDRAS